MTAILHILLSIPKSQPTGSNSITTRMFKSWKEYIVKEWTLDADHDVKEGTDATVTAIHDQGTKHDERTEEMFKYIQIFTAIINSFTHGANDVANAMGPFSAVFFTWKHNKVATKNPDIGGDMYWILALGTSHEWFHYCYKVN